VGRFNEQAKRLQPDAESLERDREIYRQFLLAELFDFGGLKRKCKGFEELIPDLDSAIIEVAEKFVRRLSSCDNTRVKTAAAYFLDKLRETIENLHIQLPAFIGQSKEKAAKADHLINWVMARITLVEHFSESDFTANIYLGLKKSLVANKSGAYLKALNAKPNEKLFNQLMAWRDTVATKDNMMPNMVLSEKTLEAIAEKLPAVLKALSAVKGVGPQKAAQYGADVIAFIRAYEYELQGQDVQQASLF